MTPEQTISSPPRRLSSSASLGVCAINWLLPGAGYLMTGDKVRGISLIIIINSIFLIGLALNGYLYVPPFRPGTEGFNMVALLTFIVQLCHGGGCLLLLLAGQAGGVLDFLVRNAGASYSDLGAFHLTVAAALNYFATVRLWEFTTGKVEEEEKKKQSSEIDGKRTAEREEEEKA